MTTRASTADLLAGLSIAGLLLPEAVAYSGVANLPPQAGLIALFAGLVCYGLIGRSRFAIVSATSSSAAVLASATLTLGGGELAQRVALAATLVVGGGIAFALAGFLRLGAISNLIARPVLRGYAFGLALVIAVKQWPHLLGMHAQWGDFFPLVAEMVRGTAAWQGPSLGCGLIALAGLFGLERVARVPGTLVVIVASILASQWLAAHGVALTRPAHLALAMPAFALPAGTGWLPLTEFAFALMFILYAESYGSIRTFALRHDEEGEPNRDPLAPRAPHHRVRPVPGHAGRCRLLRHRGKRRGRGAVAFCRPVRGRHRGGAGAAVPQVDRAHPGAGAGGDRHPRGEQVAAHQRVQGLFPLAAGSAGGRGGGAGGDDFRRAERVAGGDRVQSRHAPEVARESAPVGARPGRRA